MEKGKRSPEVRIETEITGITPMLVNRFTEEAQLQATNGSSVAAPKQRKSPEEDAESRLYKDSDGRPVMPEVNIVRCFMEAGRFFQYKGKSKVTTQKSSIIPACLMLEEGEVPILNKNGELARWEVDMRPVCIQNAGRILRYRPRFDEWLLHFTMVVDTDLMNLTLLRDIVDMAGRVIGMGDFRPACKGPFGRFKVTLWKELRD